MMSLINLSDKLIIFVCCLIFYLFQTDVDVNVLAVLISIIFSSFLSYFDSHRLKTILTMGFIILCCFMPALIFFFPLIAYDMIFHKYQGFNLFGIIPLLLFAQKASTATFSVIIILLFLSILVKYRAQAHIALHTRYNEQSDITREMSAQLKKQNRDLIENQDTILNLATLNERNRIAREIHDNVGHLLSSTILQSGALLTVTQDEEIRENLKTINATLSQAMDNIRASVHQLYDESIDLGAQIEAIIKKFTFCPVSYDYTLNSNPDRKIKNAFISIVNEALFNIIKHSNATHASIALREHPALYQLIIRDNGTVKSYSTDNGLGINNMISRVHSLNGNINIIVENGFEIFISIPKEGPKA